jgi:hypothetical protein
MLIAILLTFQARLVSFTQIMKTSKREKITKADEDGCKLMTMPHMDHFENKMAINIICDVHIIWKLNMATRSNMVSYWLNLQTS